MSSVKSRSALKPALPAPKARVLLVQADSEERSELHRACERAGFEPVSTSTVSSALSLMSTQQFHALISDLHLPSSGDGFTVINAMRHFHPTAPTMVLSRFPALRESVAAFLPQADEILLTPIPAREIVSLLTRNIKAPRIEKARIFMPVSTVLETHAKGTISEWLRRVKGRKTLSHVALSDQDRMGHLPTLFRELVKRLRAPHLNEGHARLTLAAAAHGRVRKEQGYTAAMLVEESRILQVCIFKTLRTNLGALDLSMVLTDVMTIADEVDSQLAQTIAAFSGHVPQAESGAEAKKSGGLVAAQLSFARSIAAR